MIHASLFSGIGGFDLAAEWAGWGNAFNCEIDPFCRRVLKYHFPDAIQYDDIKTADFTVWRGKIDILTGGFPCQPFSTAGKRKGTSDDRYLWPEMLRAIREINPLWVVGENVLGIVSWDGGLVFEQVHSDLEAEGYEVQAFILPACGVGAPHLRYRTWFVAHAIENSERNRCKIGEFIQEGTEVRQFRDTGAGSTNGIHIQEGDIANTKGERREEYNIYEKSKRPYIAGVRSDEIHGRWSTFPTQSPVCSRDDGFPILMDGITFPKWRAESIKAYGNAIVPQVAYRIFDAINKYESL